PAPAAGDSSGIAYDALPLEQDAAKTYENNKITADVQPTIFYRQVSGGLRETVDAFVRFNGPVPEGVAELRMHDKRYQTKLSSFDGFGERRISFEVPEWTGTATGKLQLNVGRLRAFNISLEPARKWTLFVVPHTHLDIGF